MAHLTLVVSNTVPQAEPVKQPVSHGRVTAETFLRRQVRGLKLGGSSLGALIDETVGLLESADGVSAIRRTGELTTALMDVGVWVCPATPEQGLDVAAYAVVTYPTKLVQRFPALKSNQDALGGLCL